MAILELLIEINEKFYKGSLVEEKEIIKEIQDATIVNAFGKNSVKLLENEGFISPKNVLLVDNVPHAQYAKID